MGKNKAIELVCRVIGLPNRKSARARNKS